MITIRNLSKKYREQTVLDGVSLEIPAGRIFALLGPNGSGKTTLLKSILGLVHPETGGEIIFEGVPVAGAVEYKRRIGYMPQAPKFPPHLKVSELVGLLEELRQTAGPRKEELLGGMQMGSFWEKPFGELSGGMAQKVNILQCFMFDLPLLILDEPTAGLDPHAAFYLKQLIREKRSAGASVIFTSHIMSEVDELADQMAFLVNGKIVTLTSPETLKGREGIASLEEALHRLWDKAVYG